MRDNECVELLQWALPELQLRWAGFRKVRGQVCKRISRRMAQLGIDAVADYRAYLLAHEDEWNVVDSFCQITISRFYRDKAVYDFLTTQVLPELAQRALDQGRDCLSIWSVGCSSGEEPYTIALIWKLRLQPQFPGLHLKLVASDANPAMGQRVKEACYPFSSIKNLSADWRDQAFVQRANCYCLKPEYRCDIRFLHEDVRESMPTEVFDLVLCRNLVFTYFEEPLQRTMLEQMQAVIRPDGALVIGVHEYLPEGVGVFTPWSTGLPIYRNATGALKSPFPQNLPCHSFR